MRRMWWYRLKRFKNIKEGYWLGFLLLLVVILYFPLLRGFFEQDEWSAFGRFFAAKEKMGVVGILTEPFTFYKTHYVPLSHLGFNIQTAFFGLNYTSFAVGSILGHLAVVMMAYWVYREIFEDKRLTLLATAILALGASGSQATTWMAASIGTHWASFFGLLALYFLVKYFRAKEEEKGRVFLLMLVSIFVSLMFKEIAIGLLAMVPLVLFYYGGKIKRGKRVGVIVIFVGVVYVLFRLGIVLFSPVSVKGDEVVSAAQGIGEIAVNLGILPVSVLAESVVPPDWLLLTVERMFSASVLVIFLVLVLIMMLVLRNSRERRIKRVMVWALIFVVVNSFVYALSPGRSGRMVVIDSRNLYFPFFGTAIVLTLVVDYLWRKRIFWGLVAAGVLLMVNMYWLNREIKMVAEKGSIRKAILADLKTVRPDLPDKAIVYTESDRSYYGLSEDERILPFQSGFGHTTLVWYAETEKYPGEFFEVKDRFLWGILDEGYKEYREKGFGYFRDFEEMMRVVEENGLSVEAVVGLRYDSEGKRIFDNTDEIRGRMRGCWVDKKEIAKKELVYRPSVNEEGFGLAVDGIRETYWDSGVQYMFPQRIDIEMEGERKIAEILLDSCDNVNQNMVGYRVCLSSDGEEWREVFYSKRYPPDSDGLTRLYFEPTWARYVRVEQKGYHKYATWVVYELRLFEQR